MEDTSPSGSHTQDRPLDLAEGEGLPRHNEQQVYNSPSLSSEGGEPLGVVQNKPAEVSCDQHMRGSSGSGISASEVAKSGHMTDGREDGSSGDGESRNQRWNQNEPRENVNPPNCNFASSADISSHGEYSHAMCLPLQPTPNQPGEVTSFIQTIPEPGATVKGLESDQSHSPHLAATPTNPSGVVPVIMGTKEPTALSSFKRHIGETYSSDDDDVFLPNPPSKTQADKCIVAMDTEGEEERGVASTAILQAPQIVVTPDWEEEEEQKEGEGEGLQPQAPWNELESATGIYSLCT